MVGTQYRTYHCTIPYQKPESRMKDMGGRMTLTEKNDADNDVYRSAAAKAIQAAEIDRYSQGTFDLSLLVAGKNAESYFTGTMSDPYDVDYFHVDTVSQILSKRPVIVRMEMPEGADYDLAVYDEQGNQVGMAVRGEDGSKTLTIPCDWSASRKFVIKINQHNTEEGVEGAYKLTFAEGEMPRDVADWLERVKTAGLTEGGAENRRAAGVKAGKERDAKNADGIEKLHERQHGALPEELRYKGSLSVSDLLEKEKNGEKLSEAERAHVAIYGNQNEIYRAEGIKRKRGAEQEFSDFLASAGITAKPFEIKLSPSGKVTVIGVEEAQRRAVEEYVEKHQNTFRNIYLTTSKEAAEMTDTQYRMAGYAEECSRLLAGASDGTISVEDLEIREKQAGKYTVDRELEGLPANLAHLINGAGSTDRYYEYQQMMYNILDYQKIHGEIPRFHMDFEWNGQELGYETM